MNTSFGETLKNAREAKGLTTSQVAAQTRMLVQIVEEMENEDFHRIAAPIYGRGFVKLYAECVGIDPTPLVKEFMDIYEGRRAPTVRTRDVPMSATPPATEPAPEPPPVAEPVLHAPEPAPEPPPVAEPVLQPAPEPAPVPPALPETEPVQETPQSVRGLDLFESAALPRPLKTPPPSVQPPATNVADIFADSPYLSTASTHDAEGPSAAERFRIGLSCVSHGVIGTVRDIPRSVWRIAILALAFIAILALLAWGCMKLYQATSVQPANPPHVTVAPDNVPVKAKEEAAKTKTGKNPKPAAKPAKPVNAAKAPEKKPVRIPLRSTGQKVPALYVD